MSAIVPTLVRRSGRRPTSIRLRHRSGLAIYDTPPRRVVLVLVVVGLLVAPAFLSPYATNIVNLVAIATVGAVALNLLTGVAGQISLGHAALMAVGAFTTATAQTVWSLPAGVGVVLGGAAAGVTGLLVGLPSLRLRGLYLVIATLALHYVVLYLLQEYQQDEVGPAGFILPTTSLWGWEFRRPEDWYYVVVGVAALAVVLMVNLLRTGAGRAWMAIRQRDIAAEIIGVNVGREKLAAFVLTSTMVGVQGGLMALYTGVVEVGLFPFQLAIQAVAMVIIGGQGSVLGSVFGAGFVTAVPFVVRDGVDNLPSAAPGVSFLTEHTFEVQIIVYGAAIIGFLIVEPRGLAQLWRSTRDYFGMWPFRRTRIGNDQ